MDVADFAAALARDGFDDTETKDVAAGQVVPDHAHGFDLRALVLGGAMTIEVGGEATTYRTGEVFTMADGREHSEVVGPEGVRFLVGRRRAA
ncbi:MAG: cupin domain-containing protein [Janthinobacterium lividum]